MPKRKEKLDSMFYKKKCLHFCPSPTPLNWLRLVTPSSLRPKLIRKVLRPGQIKQGSDLVGTHGNHRSIALDHS